MENLYTTIGALEDLIEKDYITRGERTRFIDALSMLESQGRLRKIQPKVPGFTELMSDDVFLKLLSEMPVFASQLLCQPNPAPENALLPPGRDIFVSKYIPHIEPVMHAHDHVEIACLYRGNCTLIFDEQSRALKPGDLCIIPPGARHYIMGTADAIALAIRVVPDTFDEIFWPLLSHKELLSLFFRHTLYQSDAQSRHLMLRGDNLQELHYLIQNLAIEANRINSYSNACARNFLAILLGKLLHAYGAAMEFTADDAPLKQDFDFSLLLQYLQYNYKTATLNSLAEIFHHDADALNDALKKKLGKDFDEVIESLLSKGR